jgi:hypothetical protein
MVDFYYLGERVVHELAPASGEPKGHSTFYGYLELTYLIDGDQLTKELG